MCGSSPSSSTTFRWPGVSPRALALAPRQLRDPVSRAGRCTCGARRCTCRSARARLVFGAGLSLSIHARARLGELIKSYLLRELHDVPATPDRADRRRRRRVTDLIALLLLAVDRRRGLRASRWPLGHRRGRQSLPAGSCCSPGPRPTRAPLIDLATRPARLGAAAARPLHEMYDGLSEAVPAIDAPSRPNRSFAVPAWACEVRRGFALIRQRVSRRSTSRSAWRW